MSDLVSRITEVLREHGYNGAETEPVGHRRVEFCTCGWRSTFEVRDHDTHVAGAVVEALGLKKGYDPRRDCLVISYTEPPTTVRTVDQLDALPVGAVVIGHERGMEIWGGGPWTKSEHDGWFWWSLEYGEPADKVPLPAVLVYTPGGVGTTGEQQQGEATYE